MSYVRKRIRNKSVAEDLTQEILIKAYRAYDDYYDDGRIGAWLLRIAQNHLRNYFHSESSAYFISLDSSDDDGDSLYACLSDGETPEESYLQKELLQRIVAAVAALPEKQRRIVVYRFIEDKKTSEVADIMHIPEGSVKSASHYAINQIRKQLGLNQTERRKGATTMECGDIYKYLFIYANNTITDGDRAKVEEHIAGCADCAGIVSALKKLIPAMTFAKEDELSHFLIDFPAQKLSFCGFRNEIENYESLNECLKSRGGIIPDGEIWLSSGFGKLNTLTGFFDNEGNEIKFAVIESDDSHCRIKATYIKKLFRYMWEYQTFSYESSPYGIEKSKEAPNLYRGSMRNTFGSAVKTSLYQAIPGAAENVRIKRGNGVVDCGNYKFAYADRYVAEDEQIALEYSFVMNS